MTENDDRSNPAHLLKQAEFLKANISKSAANSVEAWTSRLRLQDIYQQLLITDLEFALDKKAEQDLWNYAFKNQITWLQQQGKDKKNPKRGEMQSSLVLFLETASGFYMQLLQVLCCAYDIDLPRRRSSAALGVISDLRAAAADVITEPKRQSCMYICQHCLVHLGDIARYRNEMQQAESYYRHAVNIVPFNGQPYNQLAILDSGKGDKLATVFYYIYSISVKHPFPVAATNLEKLYGKMTNSPFEWKHGRLTLHDTLLLFLHLQAHIHIGSGLDQAFQMVDKLQSNLALHVCSSNFPAAQLLQMSAINMFTVGHCRRNLLDLDNGKVKEEELLSKEEKLGYDIALGITAVLFNVALVVVGNGKQEVKHRELSTLAVIKLLFDWLRGHLNVYNETAFTEKVMMWSLLSKLLNIIQLLPKDNFDINAFKTQPLPEDWDLQCFLPLTKGQSSLDFTKEWLPQDQNVKLRVARLVEHGQWLATEMASLNLLKVHTVNGGKLLHFETPKHLNKTFSIPGLDDEDGDRQTSARVEHGDIHGRKLEKSVNFSFDKTAGKNDSNSALKPRKTGKDEKIESKSVPERGIMRKGGSQRSGFAFNGTEGGMRAHRSDSNSSEHSHGRQVGNSENKRGSHRTTDARAATQENFTQEKNKSQKEQTEITERRNPVGKMWPFRP